MTSVVPVLLVGVETAPCSTRLTSGQAMFFWRNGRVLRNTFLPPELPVAYFAGGNVQSQCRIVQGTVSQSLKFCEDAVFWDVAGEGRDTLDRRLIVSCDPSRCEAPWSSF
jgi:hypothetical protein